MEATRPMAGATRSLAALPPVLQEAIGKYRA
jgi:hypothetical protein